MTNGTLFGLIVGGLMTVVGIIATGISWRRLHRGGERPGAAFKLLFAAGCLNLATAVVSVIATVYEYAGTSPWRTTSATLLAGGATWTMLAGMSEHLFAPRQLPSPPPEDLSLPSDTRSLPPG